MKSAICKRSVVLAGRKTSVSLENEFWKPLQAIAKARAVTLSDLIASINVDRQHGNLSSALRLFVLGFYRDQVRNEHLPASLNMPPKPASQLVAGNGYVHG
jgi:predicted DNA-binding ribbon-helix-helix protein